MKQSEITVGGIYLAKVSGKLVPCRVDEIRTVESVRRYSYASIRKTRYTTCYDVTNMRTGRKLTFRAATKFRMPADRDGRGLEVKLSNLADAARRGSITPTQHDAEHAAIIREEGERRKAVTT